MATAYKTMQEIVYDTIREAIQTGRYAPGQRLVADDLAQELGTSRMPVREALHRLEVVGLVTITPHRGAIVSELSAKEIVEIYHIRAVLEGLATRLAAPHLTPADFERLSAAIEGMAAAAATEPDLDQMLRQNREYHITIWQAARAPRLQELLENLYDASHRFRNISILLPGRLAQVIQEHRQIFHHGKPGQVGSQNPFQSAFRGGDQFALPILTGKNVNAHARVSPGIHHQRPAQAEVSGQTGLFQQFPLRGRQQVLPPLEVAPDAIVFVRPEALAGSTLQQKDTRPARDEDQDTRDQHVTVKVDTLVCSRHEKNSRGTRGAPAGFISPACERTRAARHCRVSRSCGR